MLSTKRPNLLIILMESYGGVFMESLGGEPGVSGLYPISGKNTVELLSTKRPNLLIILMESYGGVFMESLGGEPGVSPNLERLAKEGVFFTNFYANSFRTDRGTICTFSGYQSFPLLSVMKIPAKSRTLPSIAGKLVNEGLCH